MHLGSQTKESFKTIHLEIINDMKKRQQQQQQETITNVKSCYVKLTTKKTIKIKMNNRDCCSSR